MMVKPTVAELLKKSTNRYELVIATSKRARQIANGDKPKTDVDEESPVTLAANEIAEGKVTIIKGEDPNSEEENEELPRKLLRLTSSLGSKIPTSHAMASAVALLSPVIMNTRMPASRHFRMLPRTSTRAGSLMPHTPNSVRSLSSASKLFRSSSFLPVTSAHHAHLCEECFGPS